MPVEHAAFGLRVRGLPIATPLPLPGRAETNWPTLTIESVLDDAPRPSRLRVTDDEVTCGFGAGRWLHARRIDGVARIHGSSPITDEAWLHPVVSGCATATARWFGREALHAGVYLACDGSAWCIAGATHRGKSSALAALHLAGRRVIADDALVTDGRTVFAGASCVDLREPIASEPDLRELLGRSRDDLRRRLDAGSAPRSAPLGGFVVLEWGRGAPALQPVAASERLSALVSATRMNPAAIQPRVLLEALARPMLRATRERTWASAQALAAIMP